MAFPATAAPTETTFTASPTDHDCDLPATINTGDLLLLLFGSEDAGSSGITAGPAGWTELINFTELRVSYISMGVYAKVADGTEDGGTARITTGVGGNGASHCYRITNWLGAIGGVEASSAIGGSGTSPDPPSLTAGWGVADNLFFAFGVAVDDGESFDSAPTNYGNLVSTVSGADENEEGEVGSARRELAASIDDPGVFTLSGVESYLASTVVVQPSVSGTPWYQYAST